MSTNTPRMRDSIERTNKWFRLGSLIATVFVALLLFAFPTYLRDFQQRAGAWWGMAGILLLIASALMAWFSDRYAESWTYYLGWLILLALAIMAACGFNFDMFGIAERP